MTPIGRLTAHVSVTIDDKKASTTFQSFWDQLCKRVEGVFFGATTAAPGAPIVGYREITINGETVKVLITS